MLVLKSLISLCFFLYVQSDCSDETNCKNCVEHKSWIGSPCRWCNIDNKCHTFGAILTNPCSKSEYVTQVRKCLPKFKIHRHKYNATLALKMAMFSAVAYSPNASEVICAAFPKENLTDLSKVTLPCSGGTCSGYVVLDHTEKAIIIVFRGTKGRKQLLSQFFKVLLEPKEKFSSGGKVQQFFRTAFELVWNKLEGVVLRYVSEYPKYRVFITGHSLGGAMASLASSYIAYHHIVKKGNLFSYTFGQPRVGDFDYANSHDRLVPASFRVVHYRDPVSHLPPCKTVFPGSGCITRGGFPYHDGTEIFYNKRIMGLKSDFTVCHGSEDPTCSNNRVYWAKCLLPSESKLCLNDHRTYFGVPVGRWWKQDNLDSMKC